MGQPGNDDEQRKDRKRGDDGPFAKRTDDPSIDFDLDSLPQGAHEGDEEDVTAESELSISEVEELRERATQAGFGATIAEAGEDPESDLETLPEADIESERETLPEARRPGPPTSEQPTSEARSFLDDDLETMAPEISSSTGAGGDTVGDLRGRDTLKGSFASTQVVGPRDREEDEETVFDPSGSERHTGAPMGGTGNAQSQTAKDIGGRTGRGGTRAGERTAAGATARDPIAASSSEASQAGMPVGPLVLREGDLLAERYELVKRLGKGGMGEVWKARHTLLKGMRAIKLIKATISRDPAFRERFLAEGQAMMRVKHPGVVEVTDLDETRGNRELFMVMECLDGRTLYDAIRNAEKPLGDDLRAVVRIYKELAEGMQRIHDEHIVHKDLKSDNVLLVPGEDGHEHPKVIDFGLAKQMDDSDRPVGEGVEDDPEQLGYEPDLRTTLSGTLAYMAPEQFLGKPSSFQSDIYAFGVMFHECFMNGEYPLPRGGLAHYLKLHSEGAKPEYLAGRRPDLDRDIVAVADRCMALRKADRPQSFAEVAEQMQYWLDTPERIAKRNRVLAIAGVFVLLVGISAYQIIFGGETIAALSGLSFTTADGKRALTDQLGDNQYFVAEDLLEGVRVAAEVGEGELDPTLEIQGEPAEFEFTVTDGLLNGTVDLSALADGKHEFGFRAHPNGSATSVTFVVDRTPPTIGEISVQGARGQFTNAQNPTVVVRVPGEAEGHVKVYGLADGPRQTANVDEVDSERFTIAGTASADGDVEVEVLVEDLAGNQAKKRFTYTRDTVAPEISVPGLRKDDGTTGMLLPLRGEGAEKLTLALPEAGTAVLTVGGASKSAESERGGELTFELPEPNETGLAAQFVFTDRAGNVVRSDFTVKKVEDRTTLLSPDTGFARLVTAGADPVNLQIERSYMLDGKPLIQAERALAADGSAVATPEQRELRATFVRVSPFVGTLKFDPQQLGNGNWVLTAPDLAGARFDLTVDNQVPLVSPPKVFEAGGREVTGGVWALTRDLQVTVDVSDLSLKTLTLADTRSVDALQPGRRTYRFNVQAPVVGTSTYTLAYADAAGNNGTQVIEVKADWEPPRIAELRTPRPGVAYKDLESIPFAGVCSESECRFEISGPDIRTQTSSAVSAATDFSSGFRLPVGTHQVSLVAIDQAGHRSAPRTVSVLVERAEGLASQIKWETGASSQMQLVKEGAVLMKSRLFSVGNIYLDRTEVTNAQYRRFLAAAGPTGNKRFSHPDQPSGWNHTPDAETWTNAKFNHDDQPVVNVGFWDAYAYAKWSGRRLPTEAEWLKAAVFQEGEDEQREYPHVPVGAEFDAAPLAVSDGRKLVAPVSAVTGADESPAHCLHMGGNASEWVVLSDARKGDPDAGLAGGSWFFSARAAKVRDVRAKGYDRSTRDKTMGFRCAIDADALPGSSQ